MSATKAAKRASQNSLQRPPRTIIQSDPNLAAAEALLAAPTSNGNSLRASAGSPAGLPAPREISADDIVAVQSSDDTNQVLVALPIGELPTGGHVRKFHNIDCRLSDPGHKAAFQKLFYGLNQSHVTLNCGKHIDTPADVVRYLLERYTLATSGS